MTSAALSIEESKPRISVLIVDDDFRIRNLLKRFLKKSNCFSMLAENYDIAINYLENFSCDIAIVDVMMPGKDGFELAKVISTQFKVPVFMLTARNEINYKLYGFESGAEDYLTKPFEPEELLVRMKAIVRRNQASQEKLPIKALDNGVFFLDSLKQVLKINGKIISLTDNENALLNIFDKHKNKVLSRDSIINELNVTKEFLPLSKKINNKRLVDLQITRLRKKMEPNPAHPIYLKTVRGIGYKLSTDT